MMLPTKTGKVTHSHLVASNIDQLPICKSSKAASDVLDASLQVGSSPYPPGRAPGPPHLPQGAVAAPPEDKNFRPSDAVDV